jgi:hypothetical protein
VTSAPSTPFEGLVNKIEVIPLPNNESSVRRRYVPDTGRPNEKERKITIYRTDNSPIPQSTLSNVNLMKRYSLGNLLLNR